MTILERLHRRRKINPETGCWEWTGVIHRTRGYGRITIWKDGQRFCRGVHRVAYEEYKGKIPDGLCVLHKCDNRKCFNPDHLFIGTEKDNSEDMVRKGRCKHGAEHYSQIHPELTPRGSCNGQSKLSEKDVFEIRRKYIPRVYSQFMLAREYGVKQPTISEIINHRKWKHVA